MERKIATQTFQPTSANAKFLNPRKALPRGQKSRLINAALDELRKKMSIAKL